MKYDRRGAQRAAKGFDTPFEAVHSYDRRTAWLSKGLQECSPPIIMRDIYRVSNNSVV